MIDLFPIGHTIVTMDLPMDSFSQALPDVSLDETDQLLDQTSSLSIEDSSSPLSRDTTTPATNHFQRTSVFRHQYTPRKSSPLKDTYVSEDQDLILEDVDSDDFDEDMEDVVNTSIASDLVNKPSLMLSPTILGAKLATSGSSRRSSLSSEIIRKASNEELDYDEISTSTSVEGTPTSIQNRSKRPRNKSKLSQEVSVSSLDMNEDSFDSSTSYNDSSSIQHSTPTKITTYASPSSSLNHPQQIFQLHHHHYYPSPSKSQSRISPDRSSNDTTFDNSYDDSQILPSPWSRTAQPKQPTPYIISSYLQLAFNAFTSSIAIYILINAIQTVKADINRKMEQHAKDLVLEIAQCARHYVENRCHPETRVAAIEEQCIAWERCMNQDPTLLASKASVSAETLGVIVNSLVEPIGGKAIVVCVIGFVTWAFVSNFFFGFVRAKSYYGWDENTTRAGNAQQGILGEQGNNVLEYQSPLKPVAYDNEY